MTHIKKFINLEVLFQVICLFAIPAMLIYALTSGVIQYYVHPRMEPLLWFSAAALIVVGLFLLPGLRRPRHSVHLLPYLLVLFPLMTAFALPPTTVTGSGIQLAGLSYEAADAGTQTEATDSPSEADAVADAAGLSETQADDTSTYTERTFTRTYDTEGTLQVADEDFLLWYMDVYDHIDQYLDIKIKFRAQVFRLDEFADNEFVPARMSMWCCAADVQPIGFLCRWDDAPTLADDEWIWITATVGMGEYNGESMPILTPVEITQAEEPEVAYVY